MIDRPDDQPDRGRTADAFELRLLCLHAGGVKLSRRIAEPLRPPALESKQDAGS